MAGRLDARATRSVGGQYFVRAKNMMNFFFFGLRTSAFYIFVSSIPSARNVVAVVSRQKINKTKAKSRKEKKERGDLDPLFIR
jgi:hypothetical protein